MFYRKMIISQSLSIAPSILTSQYALIQPVLLYEPTGGSWGPPWGSQEAEACLFQAVLLFQSFGRVILGHFLTPCPADGQKIVLILLFQNLKSLIISKANWNSQITWGISGTDLFGGHEKTEKCWVRGHSLLSNGPMRLIYFHRSGHLGLTAPPGEAS